MTNLVLSSFKTSYISSGKPDENFAKSIYLYVGVDCDFSEQSILVLFDLSLLPNEVTIESAVFKMYADGFSDKTCGSYFGSFLINSPWDEKDVTWNNRPCINKSVSGETVYVDSAGWYSWDITNIVDKWVNKKAENNGILITSFEDKVINEKRFHSLKSFYHKNFRPIIEINYDFKNKFFLNSRNIVNNVETLVIDDSISYTSWQNTSIYSMYTYFVQNNGSNPVSVYVQVSPDRAAIYDEKVVFTLAPGDIEAIVPEKYGFYTRLALKSQYFDKKSYLKIWFQAQV